MRKVLFIAASSWLIAAQVEAQLLQPPPRSLGGVFGGPRTANPNRTGHELSATVSLLGSYEDNLSLGGEGAAGDSLLPRRSGAAGILSGNALYRYGRAARSIETRGQAYVHSFRNIGVDPLIGGNADVRASTELNARTTLTAGASTRYQPTFALTTVTDAAVDPQGGATPPTDPTTGFVELRSSNITGNSRLEHSWSPRQRTNLAYGYSKVRVTGDYATDTVGHEGTLVHNWDLNRSATILGSYQYSGLRSEANQQDDQPAVPADTHAGNIGLELRRRVSRTRTLSFSGGGGAMRVKTISSFGTSLEYVAPSGFGGMRLDLGRTWAVTFDARRDVTVLDGLTAQSFLTDMGTLWVGGRVADSWLLTVSGYVSRGNPHEGDVGSYEAANGTIQLQYAMTRTITLLGSYAFYRHTLRAVNVVPEGVPSRFERNAVSIGVSIWMPFYGQFPAGSQPGAGR